MRSKRKSNNRRKNTRRSKPRKQVQVPAELTSAIVLFDEDEFYGVFLDLLLDSLNKAQFLHICTQADFDMFKKAVVPGKYNQNIYIIDELFGWGTVDVPNLVKNLRILDEKAHVIGMTAVTDGEIRNKELYDTVVIKGKSNNDSSMAKSLADILGVELQLDNSDPEYQ